VLPAAFARSLAALKPGGWLLLGIYPTSPDRLAQRLTVLRTVRSGGSSAGPDELLKLIADAGFAEVQAVERTWQAPLAFLAGRRPALGPAVP
jgi:hypothetical protein